MMRDLYDAARAAVGTRIGERRLPIGPVARDRRLLRRALRDRIGDRVLVVGPGLAARQAFRGSNVDVTGTSPHSAEVTVCSAVNRPEALPRGRWSTVIVMESGPDPVGRLGAARHACGESGTILLLDRVGWDEDSAEVAALARFATVSGWVGRPSRRAWLARVTS